MTKTETTTSTPALDAAIAKEVAGIVWRAVEAAKMTAHAVSGEGTASEQIWYTYAKRIEGIRGVEDRLTTDLARREVETLITCANAAVRAVIAMARPNSTEEECQEALGQAVRESTRLNQLACEIQFNR